MLLPLSDKPGVSVYTVEAETNSGLSLQPLSQIAWKAGEGLVLFFCLFVVHFLSFLPKSYIKSRGTENNEVNDPTKLLASS